MKPFEIKKFHLTCVAWLVLTMSAIALSIKFDSEFNSWEARHARQCPEVYQTYPATTDITSFKSIVMGRAAQGFCGRRDYTITISSDGEVLYQGKGFVKIAGEASSRLVKDEMNELVAALNASGYFAIPDMFSPKKHYKCMIYSTDGEATATTVTVGSKTRTINHYGGPPKQLTEFENTIDRITHSEKWLGTADEQKALSNACFSRFQ